MKLKFLTNDNKQMLSIVRNFLCLATVVIADTITLDNLQYTETGLNVGFTVTRTGSFQINTVAIQITDYYGKLQQNVSESITNNSQNYTIPYKLLEPMRLQPSITVSIVGYGTYLGEWINHSYTDRKIIQVTFNPPVSNPTISGSSKINCLTSIMLLVFYCLMN